MAEATKKVSYVGAPAIFELKLACQQLAEAFDSFGIYHVGSSLERPDWRDVDVRMIMADDDFYELFPGVPRENGYWEGNPRWLLMTASISAWLAKRTGLPVDFQFQPQTFANQQHKGARHCLNMKINEPVSSQIISESHPGDGTDTIQQVLTPNARNIIWTIEQQLGAEVDALKADLSVARAALTYYADQFCEHGRDFEGCGRLTSDQCSGCLARSLVSERAVKEPADRDVWLLQRLRALVHPPTGAGWLRSNPDGEEAAAHIEALATKVDAQTAAYMKLHGELRAAETKLAAVEQERDEAKFEYMTGYEVAKHEYRDKLIEAEAQRDAALAVLQFYGDEKNYHEDYKVNFPFRSSQIEHDRGRRARQALTEYAVMAPGEVKS